MANSLKLTRNQLAGFLKDFEQIKQFEKLFSLSEDYLNSGMIDGIALDAGNATAAAYAVAAALQELSEELANEPPAVDLSAFEARLQALEQLPPVPDDGLASRVDALESAPPYVFVPAIPRARTVTASDSYTADDYFIAADCTAGAITLTLPVAASSKGRTLVGKKIDASANVMTIDGDGAETVDGAANVNTAVQYASFTLLCDGATWWIAG